MKFSNIVASLAVCALASLAGGGVAAAQAPPAAVDQYRPAPPGNPPENGRPGGPNGSDPAGPGAAVTGAPAVGPGEPPVPIDEGTAGDGTADRGGGGGSKDTQARSSDDDFQGADGPGIAGYPLTSSLLVLIIAIVIGLCAALGVAAWRRYRGGAALAGSS